MNFQKSLSSRACYWRKDHLPPPMHGDVGHDAASPSRSIPIARGNIDIRRTRPHVVADLDRANISANCTRVADGGPAFTTILDVHLSLRRVRTTLSYRPRRSARYTALLPSAAGVQFSSPRRHSRRGTTSPPREQSPPRLDTAPREVRPSRSLALKCYSIRAAASLSSSLQRCCCATPIQAAHPPYRRDAVRPSLESRFAIRRGRTNNGTVMVYMMKTSASFLLRIERERRKFRVFVSINDRAPGRG